MPSQKLISYIRSQLNKGIPQVAIKKTLKQAGYPDSEVREAFRYIPQEIRHTIHFSKTVVVVLVLISLGLIVTGAAVYLTLQQPKAPEQLLDLKLDIVTRAVQPGQTLEFNVELASIGTLKRYDVNIAYYITNKDTNKLLLSKSETIGVETRASTIGRIRIPPSAPAGDYILRATAKYSGKTATASDTFRIYKELEGPPEKEIPVEPEPEKQCPETCNDNDICTDDTCSESTNFECVNEPLPVCCGNSICEETESFETCPSDCQPKPTGDVLEDIKVLAVTEPEKAAKKCSELERQSHRDRCYYNIAEARKDIQYCSKIIDEVEKDNCYTNVALVAKKSSICEAVTRVSARDACYMNFVSIKDYSVCDKLSNEYLRESCEQLKALDAIVQSQS